MIAEVLYLLTYPFNIAGVFFAVRGVVFRDPAAAHYADGLFAITSTLAVAYYILEDDLLLAGVFAVIGAWLAWNWWRKRKRRDPAARSLGAKSKARLAALVARARESAKPRRVLRPVPGAAP